MSAPEPGKEVITLKLVPQDGGEPVEIRAKKSTKIDKLMEAYANNKSIARDSFKLMLAGRFIKAGTTLGEVEELEDGDQLDVVLHQVGGGR